MMDETDDVFTASYSAFQNLKVGENFDTDEIIKMALHYQEKVPFEDLLKLGEKEASFIDDSPFVKNEIHNMLLNNNRLWSFKSASNLLFKGAVVSAVLALSVSMLI